jgi:hypothetical protein
VNFFARTTPSIAWAMGEELSHTILGFSAALSKTPDSKVAVRQKSDYKGGQNRNFFIFPGK